MIDLVIIGGGPSAFSAAIYASRAGLSVQIFEKSAMGGMIATSDWVENYPGFEDGISGVELSQKMRKQAEKFGANIDYGDVTSIEEFENGVKIIVDGSELKSKFALIASGNTYRKLGLDKEEELFGRGVHSCATCDGAFYEGKNIITVGGGDSAVQETIFLSRFAKKIYLLVRGDFRAQSVLLSRLDKLVKTGKVEVLKGTEISEILTKDTDFGQKVYGVKTVGNNELTIEAEGIFEFIGLIPNTDFLKDSGVLLNDRSEVIVNDIFQTNKKRIFASGDVVQNAEKQAVVAVATGAKAAIEIAKIYHNE